MIESWQSQYSPTKGGKRPLILDGGLDLDKITDVNFRELDFKDSITSKDLEILVALGVPEVLISSGNNANITPNLRLFYMETILPLVRMVNAGFERFFGYDLEPEASKVSAIQPDLKDEAMYHSTLVNGGVISPNEARAELRYDPKPGHDDLRVPANIAGSAAGEPGGGAPKKDADK
jgi:phage portal protein BeeE